MAIFDPGWLADSMRQDSLRVHPPTTAVFLCGGTLAEADPQPSSLRDAFYRGTKAVPPAYAVLLAEDAAPLTADAGYDDLFRFESDIAQLVGLIVLFAESPGSLAELGAFAALGTVAPSLLAVLDDFYYDQVSFIRNGPVRYLENEYGEEWITVLDRTDVGIGANGSLAGLDQAALMAAIIPAIEKRLEDRAKWSKLDLESGGHGILLMTGLCQEYGALTKTEIRDYLEMFGFPEPRMKNFLYCAQLLGWIRKVRKGHHIFYVATGGDPALDFALDAKSPFKDKLRWRSAIRHHWRTEDTARFKAIADVTAPVVAA